MMDRLKFRVWDIENKEYHSMNDVINNNGELGCAAGLLGLLNTGTDYTLSNNAQV